jgi:hypothetical protein
MWTETGQALPQVPHCRQEKIFSPPGVATPSAARSPFDSFSYLTLWKKVGRAIPSPPLFVALRQEWGAKACRSGGGPQTCSRSDLLAQGLTHFFALDWEQDAGHWISWKAGSSRPRIVQNQPTRQNHLRASFQ